MYEQVEKSKENKSTAVANSVSQKQSNSKQGTGFLDNRPIPNEQRKLKAISPMQQSSTKQCKLNFDDKTTYLDSQKNAIPYSSYNRVQEKARYLYKAGNDLDFKEGDTGPAAAKFTPSESPIYSGIITVKPLTYEQIENKSYDYNDRIVEVSHETHHAIDHATDLFLKGVSYTAKVISEFRTFAVQSAVTSNIAERGKSVSTKYKTFQKSFDKETKDTLLESSNNGFAKGNIMFNTIKFYLEKYSNEKFDDDRTELFINEHKSDLERAYSIYESLKNDTAGEHDRVTEFIDEEVETEKIETDNKVTITTFETKRTPVEKPLNVAWRDWVKLLVNGVDKLSDNQILVLGDILSNSTLQENIKLPPETFTAGENPELSYDMSEHKYNLFYDAKD